jgi:subfamily B ATP-binding cassette protein HlyB/CyaB
VRLHAPIEVADLAWAFASLCNLLRVPFDARLFLQRFPPPANAGTLFLAAAALGLRGRRCTLTASESVQPGAPRLALRRLADGSARVALVLCADRGELLVTERDREPRRIAFPGFAEAYEPELLEIQLPAVRPVEPAEIVHRPFGLWAFVPELLRYRAAWRDVLAASAAMQLIALATPLCTQVVIDKVIVHHAGSTLIVIVAALVLFLVFNAVLGYVRQYLLLHTGNRIDGALGVRVFEQLLSLPPRYFESRPTGTLVARLHGVETIREFLTGAAASAVLDVPFVLVFVAVMAWYSGPLTLIALTLIALLAGLSAAMTPALRRRINEQFFAGARNQALVTEYVSAMDTVKALQMEPQLAARYAANLDDYLRTSFATRQLANLYAVSASALEQALTVAILAAGAWLVMTSDGFTIGMLVAFQMFAARLAQPALRLAGLWQEFQQAAIAVRRLGDLMDAPAESYALRPSHSHQGPGRIEIQNLGFAYSSAHPPVFENFDLSVAPGSCVALLGPSGSGKSTLARLLLGFYLPTAGSVKIDGRDTRQLSANELRLQFGVVPQETRLFSGSVHENLAAAQPHASFAEIIEACRMAEIHEVIEALPQGYQTMLGEHGVGLSGGQKQRVAIARALLRRPRILLFDEATASLDRETAEALGRTISRLRGKVTMLFIAHYLPETLAVDATAKLDTPAHPLEPLNGLSDASATRIPGAS